MTHITPRRRPRGPASRASLSMALIALASAIALMLMLAPASALAERGDEDRMGSTRDADDNPTPPRLDPGMRRTRAVGLPGQAGPRQERTGVPYRGLKETVADEQGFGSVSKPDSKEFVTTAFPPRILYLNGVNVSSLRGETLENVRVRIDEEGNVHIDAPQYEVSTDTSFHPLLPSELPSLPKGRTAPMGMPSGRYSKQGNRNRTGGEGFASEGGEGRTKATARPPKVEVLAEEEDGAGVPVLDAPNARSSSPSTTKGSSKGSSSGARRGASEPSENGGGRTLKMNDDAPDSATGEAETGVKAVPAR